MERPVSIKRFERFWWGSTLLWGIGTRLAWTRTQNALAGDPRTASVADWAQWFNVGLVLATALLLWWLVARRASAVGKWLVVVVAGISALRALVLLGGLLLSRTPHPLSQGSFLIAGALTVGSAVMLFRDDARAWFGEFDTDEEQPI